MQGFDKKKNKKNIFHENNRWFSQNFNLKNIQNYNIITIRVHLPLVNLGKK